MLIGGMFDVDVEKALKGLTAHVPGNIPGEICQNASEKMQDTENMASPGFESGFRIRCDEKNQYPCKKMTNNGRTATTYIFANGLSLPPGKKVLAPEYMCVSVVNAFEAAGTEFEIYRVKGGLEADLEDMERKMGEDIGAIYVIHYFGFPQPARVSRKIQELSETYRVPVIEDLTQSLLSRASGRIGYGDYLVSSVRKWFPITDGGIAAARIGRRWRDVPLKDACDEAVYTQMFLSLARKWYEAKENLEDDSYPLLEKLANSKRYFDFSPREMTEISRSILAQCSMEEAIRKRRQNYTYLYKHFSQIRDIRCFGGELDGEGDVVPFGFQLMVEARDDFFRYLLERKIVGEIQWILPEQYYEPSPYARYLSRHSLMLPCDQRYGIKEMEYVAGVVQEYFQ